MDEIVTFDFEIRRELAIVRRYRRAFFLFLLDWLAEFRKVSSAEKHDCRRTLMADIFKHYKAVFYFRKH